MAKLPKQKIPLSAVLYALMPKTARRGVGVLLLLLFGPLVLLLVLVAVRRLFEQLPWLWVLVALFVLYRLAKWLFGPRE
ncbi:hypothetical protein [Allorhizocola rhizosphaerae]|uniref:hypothetical protein n=1 Tax=Allorhizocola rhizosphaerae TaxID=1872709 RepID=UPI000E3DCA77|nr:hypothetical protein [Allorhizocola rhizosphaerae]